MVVAIEREPTPGRRHRGTDHTVNYRVRRLFPDNPEMEEDEELIELLKWQNDTANYRHEHIRFPISRFGDNLNNRFVTVVKNLTDVRLVKLLFEDDFTIYEISREMDIPPSSVLDILNGKWLPDSINSRFLKVLRNQRREFTENELMLHLGNYVLYLIENDQIRIPERKPTHTLQDLIYVKDSYFLKPFEGFNWQLAFQKLRTTWYQELIRKFVEIQRLKGEQPLRIAQYGNRPLRKWMFNFNTHGKWDDPDNRIDAVCILADFLTVTKEDRQIQENDFRNKENPLKRDLDGLLEKIDRVYGKKSYLIALIEAGILTPYNYESFKSNVDGVHYRLRISQEEVEELYRKSRILIRQSQGNKLLELLSEEYSLQDANIMLGLNLDRKELMLSLYLAGCALEEIGEIVRNINNPNHRISRTRVEQIIDPDDNPLTEDEKTFHTEARKEGKVVQRQLDRLYSEFEQIGITPYILNRLVEANIDRLDETRAAILIGCDRMMLKRYVTLKRMQFLSTEETDKLEMREIYNTGIGFDIVIKERSTGSNGYDISPRTMQKRSPHTATMYMRVSNNGRNYPGFLRSIGIDPEDVYQIKVREKIPA